MSGKWKTIGTQHSVGKIPFRYFKLFLLCEMNLGSGSKTVLFAFVCFKVIGIPLSLRRGILRAVADSRSEARQ